MNLVRLTLKSGRRSVYVNPAMVTAVEELSYYGSGPDDLHEYTRVYLIGDNCHFEVAHPVTEVLGILSGEV